MHSCTQHALCPVPSGRVEVALLLQRVVMVAMSAPGWQQQGAAPEALLVAADQASLPWPAQDIRPPPRQGVTDRRWGDNSSQMLDAFASM